MLLKEAILQEPDEGHMSEPQSDTSDDEENDERTKVLKRQKKAELLLSRKYRIIRKAISDDLLLYEDDTFKRKVCVACGKQLKCKVLSRSNKGDHNWCY